MLRTAQNASSRIGDTCLGKRSFTICFRQIGDKTGHDEGRDAWNHRSLEGTPAAHCPSRSSSVKGKGRGCYSNSGVEGLANFTQRCRSRPGSALGAGVHCCSPPLLLGGSGILVSAQLRASRFAVPQDELHIARLSSRLYQIWWLSGYIAHSGAYNFVSYTGFVSAFPATVGEVKELGRASFQVQMPKSDNAVHLGAIPRRRSQHPPVWVLRS